MKRFVLAADTDNVFRIVPSVNVDGIFLKVHSSAKLDGIFMVARNMFMVFNFKIWQPQHAIFTLHTEFMIIFMNLLHSRLFWCF